MGQGHQISNLQGIQNASEGWKLLTTHKDSALPEDDTLNQDTAALVGELDEVVQLVPQDSFKGYFGNNKYETT